MYMQQKYEKCLKFSHKWLEHHPTDVAGHLHMASALYQLYQKLDSLIYYEKALSLEPRNPAALVNAAVILNALGNHSNAAMYSKKAILEQPTLQEVRMHVPVVNYCSCICVLSELNVITSHRLVAAWNIYLHCTVNQHCIRSYVFDSLASSYYSIWMTYC